MFRIVRRACFLTGLIAAVFLPPPGHAAEGRIPIFLPGTFIGASGKYIVTRNITGPAPGALIMVGAPDVDIDLNGFVLDNTGGGGAVIEFAAGSDHGAVRNGTLAGGPFSINTTAPLRKLEIVGVKSRDSVGPAAFNLLSDVANAVIRNNEIIAAAGQAINWASPVVVAQGTIEGNLVRGAMNGITICNCSSVAILNNRIEDVAPVPPIPPPGLGIGINLTACSGSLIAENTIQTVGAQGISIRNGQGNRLVGNVIRTVGSHGIFLDYATSETLVVKNNSSGNGFANPPGDGLLVEGDLSVILDNLFNSNQRNGIHFSGAIAPPPAGACVPPPPFLPPPACSNTFTRNTARNNAGGPPVTPCAGVPAFAVPNFCNDVAGCPAAAGANNTGGQNLGPAAPPF